MVKQSGDKFIYANVHEKGQLYYWHREKRGSSAEVVYLIEHQGQVVPVEVKSGSSGKMQRVNRFLEEKKSLMYFCAYCKLIIK